MNLFYPFLPPVEMLKPPTEEERALWKEQARLEWIRKAGPAAVWTADIKWKPVMQIQAASYGWFVRDLFPEASEVLPGEEFSRAKCFVLSPSGRYCYAKKILPAYGLLDTVSGSKKGRVFFDAPAMIPMLFERKQHEGGFYDFPEMPWMSLTPMELMSLRPGTRMAKGHTIVAGLGLGHQLIEVSHKPTVTEITLVERSHELVSWLLPHIRSHMDPRVPLRVLIGDAYKIVPQLTADVALIDIFARYGGNRERWLDRTTEILKGGGWSYRRGRDTRARTQSCPGIKKVWIWGG